MENLENREMPKNNIALAIIATVLGLCPIVCCINGVLGGIAIYFATLVKKKYDLGDFDGAESAAKNAKLLAYISLGLFILAIIYSIITYDAAEQEEMREKLMEMLEQYQ